MQNATLPFWGQYCIFPMGGFDPGDEVAIPQWGQGCVNDEFLLGWNFGKVVVFICQKTAIALGSSAFFLGYFLGLSFC